MDEGIFIKEIRRKEEEAKRERDKNITINQLIGRVKNREE